eukprot:TRINITY_DN2688_c0_g1_i1.p1 TRINITY_DN2688_c0_g1~~TRINITY_DN2688_c0_g1_i1.p1  ORF type:complete len:385 (+),score=42.86 TRINITY_DN2688_c0_g1_i1:316-1470(+)
MGRQISLGRKRCKRWVPLRPKYPRNRVSEQAIRRKIPPPTGPECQVPNTPEIVFLSKRSVGKSRLLQVLNAKSQTCERPENKRLINFVNIGGIFRLVDTPGFGYTAESAAIQHQWQRSAYTLIKSRPNVKHVYLLCDLKPDGFTERDKMMMEFLSMNNIDFTQVITMADRIVGEKSLLRTHMGMTESECTAWFFKTIRSCKEETGCKDISTIVTSAKQQKGIGELMYDMISRVTKDVPTKDLHRSFLLCKPPVAGHLSEGVESNTGIVPCQFLPSEDVSGPGGFMCDSSFTTKIAPKRERFSVDMKTAREVAVEDDKHDLHGTDILKRFFPILAEDYLQKNHADLNPAVKPAAEKHFGLPLPDDLRLKYATPDEKEEIMKAILK